MARQFFQSSDGKFAVKGSQEEADKKARASYVLGIIALAISWLPYTILISVILSILAISMGKQARKMGSVQKTGNGLATAALAVSFLVLLLTILTVTTLILGMKMFQW